MNRETVDLFRQLAVDRPGAVNADLASSLNNFSARLSHHEHTLEVNRELVDLCRQLAADYPGAFNVDLASALNGFSAPV